MLIKTMSPSLLLLLCLFLSFELYSQGDRIPWLGTDHERCIDHCHDTEEEFSGLLSCLSDCQRKYGEEEWGRQGRDPKREQEREQEQEQEREEREHQHGGREEDPQQKYRHCQQRCQRQEQGQQQQQRCQRRCEEQLREQEEQEQEQREERDPKQQLKQCLSQCEEQEQSQQGRRQCQQQCEKVYGDQQREQRRERNPQRESRRSEEEQQRTNPYYFHAQKFQSRFRTQEGHLRVLQKFTEKSELLRGIKNYRLAIFEANPKTFVVPHHCDADSVLFILRGNFLIL